jgi:hypothetical protein
MWTALVQLAEKDLLVGECDDVQAGMKMNAEVRGAHAWR